ncbi:MAG: 50S ribosomal protein L15 [Candidatus Shapirobacteria bacterium]
MISLSSLPKTKTKSRAKRLGRGYGSGKGGHTVGRGSKGNKARGKVRLGFSGTKVKKSWLKRLPFLRGKGKMRKTDEGKILTLGELSQSFKTGQRVDFKTLIKKGMIRAKDKKVKVLANGEITKKLEVKIPCSQSAAKKIIKAGGRIDR